MKEAKDISPNLVVKLLKQLNKLERDILCLYYLEDASVGDISVLLRKDKHYIRAVLEKILTKLNHRILKASSHSTKRSSLSE